ncbi:hypothetical protein DITRI_Ditri18aG0099000 [Diplodiscus trichospermus]
MSKLLTFQGFFLFFFFFLSNIISQANSVDSENNKCQGSCATSNFPRPLPFPFGISPRCPIQLKCNSTGVTIGEFHVLNITSTDIILYLPAKCDRPLASLSVLFGKNYAVSAANSLLLQNCSKPIPSPCEVRPLLFDKSFNLDSCSSKSDNVGCFAGRHGERLLNLEEVNNTECQLLFSSVSIVFDSERNTAVSLELARLKLEWWLEGDCNCDGNAECKDVKRGNSTVGYRCLCKEGFEGDGFKEGGSCRRVSGGCNGSKYLSGQCLGSSRVGVVVGGICLGFGLLLLLICRIYKCLKNRSNNKLKRKFFKANGGLLLKQQLSSSDGNICKTKIFTLKELATATDHFNEKKILGKGGQGTVFQGKLVDGTLVAVKRSKMVETEKINEFINEIVILSQINHRNVVKLLGCCLETQVPLLVYEFVPNGTLFHYLRSQSNEFPLTWEMRVQVASEAAGAISYLHSTASIPIYHRDIKSTNILLDEKYRAKVSDFGTSKTIAIDQSHVTTLVYGTIGYLDPEYFQTSQFTDKSDVYSFGVVLVELLTGKSPVSFARSGEDRSLVSYFIDSVEEDKLFDILDAQIIETNSSAQEIISVANLAKKCLSSNGKNRPTMKEVATELDRILRLLKNVHGEQIDWVEEIDLIDISAI